MKINIDLIPNNKSLPKEDLELVRKVILKHAKKVESMLPFKVQNFTFTVYAWDKDGIGAFTKAEDWVHININYGQLIIKGVPNEKLIDKLIYIIYHEMHHACRGYVGFLPKNEQHILISSIISEGLADHFAIEQYPSKNILETIGYDMAEISSWIKKLGKVLWNKESDDDSWLFGGKEKPKLLGYKIGRYIIQEVKEKQPKLNSINLISTSSEKILKLSGINF
ncbi:MAG: DUF2268 domain-containing putative Zn-dependent protease [Parcubacteria group bacterium]|jgi:uncharacterized protein YjaZ